MNIEKYAGVTLLFIYRNNEGLSAVQQNFITSATNLKELSREAALIASTVSKDVKNGDCTYLGVHDVFEVNGPLKQGAILGRSTLWSYKNINFAKKLLKPKTEFWIYKSKSKRPVKQFIAEIVFLLPSPIKYSDRRTIICNVLIESLTQANVYKKAISIGKSQELREKLFKVLFQFEPKLTNELIFIGIANIKYVYDKVGVGKCFEALSKNKRSVLSAKKLVFPIKKFSNYKF